MTQEIIRTGTSPFECFLFPVKRNALNRFDDGLPFTTPGLSCEEQHLPVTHDNNPARGLVKTGERIEGEVYAVSSIQRSTLIECTQLRAHS